MASGLQTPVVGAQETSAERGGEVAKTATLEAALINPMSSARGDPRDAGEELRGLAEGKEGRGGAGS